MKKVLFMTALSSLLLACAPEFPPEETAGPVYSACDVDALAHLVGLPRSALDGAAFEGPVRWLPPGSMMTMDYSAARINFELDADDIITRIFCG